MQRSGSYVAAAVVIVAVVAAVAWVLTTQPQAFPGLQTVGLYKFKAMPVGADGPLKECVVCHSVETGGALRVGAPPPRIVGGRKARAGRGGDLGGLGEAGGG